MKLKKPKYDLPNTKYVLRILSSLRGRNDRGNLVRNKPKTFFRKHPNISYLFMLLALTTISFGALRLFQTTEASAWYHDNWQYRNTLTFGNNSSADSNKKVKYDIDTSTLIAAGKMQPDCGDSRFTALNGQQLDYFIDTAGGACDTASTDYYVLIPTINGNGDTSIYHYYGNPSAENGTQSAQFSQSTFTPTSGPSSGTEEVGPGPLAYWAFDEGYGTTTNDSSGNSNSGTISGATWKTSEFCITDNCLQFDGSDDAVSLGDDDDFDFPDGTDFTFSGWIKTTSLTNAQTIIAKKTGNGSGSWGYMINLGTNGILNFYASDGDQFFRASHDNDALSANTWYHVAFVFDEDDYGSSVFYINGMTSVGSTTGTIGNVGSLATIQPFMIGAESDNQAYFKGFIDEIKIYPYARTAAQIKADYASRGSIRGTSIQFGDSDLGRKLSQNLIGYWTMEDNVSGNAQTITDKSGNANHGTTNYGANTTGMDCTTGGKYGYGCDFDGTDDYITDIADIPDGSFTLSSWIKADSVSSVHMIYWNNETELNITNTGKIRARLWTGTGYTITGDTTLQTNSWYFITFVYDQSNLHLYINGQADATPVTATGNAANGAGISYISRDDGGNYFNGKADEVRIYNRALSPSEVQALYNYAPGPVAYYNFDSATLDATTVTSQVSASSDDAEEQAGGSMSLTSSDLEMVFDITNQTVGLRFNNINIAQGETINTATIQFTVDETTNGSTSLTIQAEDTDNATTFTTTSNDITNRTTTTASVDWDNVDAWNTIGQAAGSQRTVDISSVIQEIIDRPGWTTNNSIVIIISGTGERVAESYDGVPASAPLLTIQYGATGSPYIEDISGNNNQATPYNLASSNIVPGKFGKALSFNGTDTSLGITDTDDFNFGVGDYTFGMWIKTTESCSGNKVYFGRYTTAETYWLGCNSTGNVANLNSRDDDSVSTQATGTTAINDGSWHYITGVKNGNNLYIYKNGILENTATASYTGTLNFNPDAEVVIGGNYATGGGYYANIHMDELKIYNYARTQQQIIQDMNAGHPAVGTPIGSGVLHLSFDEGYGTTANDKSPQNNDFTLSTASWTNDGKLGKAWNGNGTAYLSRADDADLDFAATDDLTISTWIKSDSATNPASTEYIFNKASATIAGYALYANTSGNIVFGIDDDTTWTPDDTVTSTTDIYDNTWHHIVATKTGTTNIKLYVDGVLKATDSSIAATGTLANSLAAYIGDRDGTDNGSEFNGDIDELKIYRFALTADQVKLEYAGGKQAVLGSSGFNTTTDTSSNSANAQYCPPGDTATTCTAPVAEWNFDEDTGTTLNDISGNNHTGTFESSPIWIPGKYGSALDFDNVDDTIQVSDSASISFGADTSDNPFSISAWINANDFTTGPVAYKGNPSVLSSDNEWALNLNVSDKLSLIIYDDNTSNYIYANSTPALTTYENTWVHVAATYDGTQDNTGISLFINGLQVGVATGEVGTYVASENTAHPLHIGGGWTDNAVWKSFIDGAIDNLRIYNYERTPSQIAWEYNKGGPLAHWKLDECSGTTANDSAINGNGDSYGGHGTITIGSGGSQTSAGTCSSGTSTEAWNNGTTGKWGASLEFDGSDDQIVITDDDRYSFGDASTDKPFSIFGWVKMDQAEAFIIASKVGDTEIFTGAEWLFGLTNTGKFGIRLYDSSTTVYIENGTNYTMQSYEGQWVHLGITYDGSGINTGIRIYVDGKEETDTAPDSLGSYTAMHNLTEDVRIGASLPDNATYKSFSNGHIDDVRIYGYELTPQQVHLLYNRSSAVRFE